ncbi:MAG TPA: methyl-accepting chemotaxis protein, partial [Hydrogenophaga sp.]|nr:methyl-accepting chemotaxis protein [Hydrogenophaga sp.]
SAAAAQSLKDQAQRLAEVIRVFKLAQGEGSSFTPVRSVTPVTPVPRAPSAPSARSGAPAVPAARPVSLSAPVRPAAKAPQEPAALPVRKPVTPTSAEGDWESF